MKQEQQTENVKCQQKFLQQQKKHYKFSLF